MYIKKYNLIFFISAIIAFIITYFIIGTLNYNYIIETSDNISKELINGLVGDARYYYHLYFRTELNIDTLVYLFFMNKNLLPPLLELYIVEGNLYVLYFINFIALLIAIKSNLKYMQQNQNIYLLFIIFAPVIVGSLFGINKEIASYISILFLLSFLLSNKNRFLFLSLIFAFFTRFELIAIIVFFIVTKNFKFNKRIYILIFLLFSISLIIYLTGYSDIRRLEAGASTNSLGLVKSLDYLNTLGLYFLSFIIKTFINLYSLVLIPNFNSLSGIFLTISSYIFLFTTFTIIKKKRFILSNDIVYFIFIYLIIFNVPSFIQHRYFIALYPLFVYLAFTKQNFNNKKVIK